LKLLELAGILDVASGAWISPIDESGDLAIPIAQVGQTSWQDTERARHAANAIPGLFSDRRGPFPAPGLNDHMVCMIGNRRVGRAALFIRQRSWDKSVQMRLSDAIERIRHIVHVVWVILKEVGSAPAPVPVPRPDARLAEALIDQHPFGVVILDLDQQVQLANQPARLFFKDSNVIAMVGGRMILNNTHDAIRMHVTLRSVLAAREEDGEHKMIAIAGSTGAPLLLSISRLAAAPTSAAIIITQPSGSTESDIQPLAEHFGLSPVEVRVVSQLVKGLSVQEAATCLHLKVQTVRTYLKQIFHKMGVHRQIELMQLMRSGALPALT
jgi:DNA-binding NarL/FixJ family response regulator